MNPEPRPRTLAAQVDWWLARGRRSFTTQDVMTALDLSPPAARAAVRRLRAKGVLVTPHRGYHVFMAPPYRWTIGCVPASEFVPQLMEHLGLDYYVALLSAGERHGSAHQRPQVFQVMVAKSRPELVRGRVWVQFVARHNVAAMAKERHQNDRGYFWVSSRETTAMDLVGHASVSGGVSNVATVLIGLVEGNRGEHADGEGLDDEKLVEAAQLSPIPWAQRLGFLLEEYAGMKAPALAEFVRRKARECVPLRPEYRGSRRRRRHPRWRLVVNSVVEPDL